MVSALPHDVPAYLAKLRRELEQWLKDHEYGSLREMRGGMSIRTRRPTTRQLRAHAAELEIDERCLESGYGSTEKSDVGAYWFGSPVAPHFWSRAAPRASCLISRF